ARGRRPGANSPSQRHGRHRSGRSLLMSGELSRRRFLLSSSLAGLGSLAFVNNLPAPAPLPSRKRVALLPELEPLVKLIEDTPRSKVLDAVLARIKKDTSYQELLGAVFLAGVRGIQPRPSVGFKFHAVLVINSAHQAAMAAVGRERWLPLLWAVDN